MLQTLKHACVLGLMFGLVACQGTGFNGTSSGLSFGSGSGRSGEAAKAEERGKDGEQEKPSETKGKSNPEAHQLPVQWPPNHRMERFVLESIPDESDLSLCKIGSISSDEVQKSAEPEDVDGDYKILGALEFEVRIERLGTGDGRIYSVNVSCGAEGEEPRQHVFEVIVPHDWSEQEKGKI